MAIHIGKEIRKQADKHKIGATELGKLLNKSRETVYDIFERESVDTELLLVCCRVLSHDFFNYYYSEEPLATFRKAEVDNWIEQIKTLTERLAIEQNHSIIKDELIANQRENIKHLKKEQRNNK